MPRRSTFVLAAVALVLAIGVGILTARLLAWPDLSETTVRDPAAGVRFQAVLAQLVLRENGLSSRSDPLVLTAADLNAFLRHNVQVKDPPVWPVTVRLEGQTMELGGATTVGRLVAAGLGRPPGGAPAGGVSGYPIWVGLLGGIRVADGRGEFRAHTALVGRQRVPLALMWRLLGGRPPALGWRMPRSVERVDVEDGRLVIHTRPGRPGRSMP